MRPLLALGRPNAIFPHQAGDPLAGDADALGLQFGMDARSPIAFAALLENSPRWNKSTGSTIDACSNQSAGSRPPRPRHATMQQLEQAAMAA